MMNRKEYQKQWAQANKERVRENKKRWEAANPDKLRAYSLKWQTKPYSPKKRYGVLLLAARRRNLEVKLTFEEYEILIATGQCHYCDKPLPTKGGSLDRMNNEPNYAVDNCVPCCSRCNHFFSNRFTYQEKLILAEAFKKIDAMRA